MVLENLIRKVINEERQKIQLKEDRFMPGTHPTRKAYWTYLETLPKDQLLRIAKSKQRIDSMDKSTPKQDLISHIFFAEFSKDMSKEIRLPEYAKKFLAKFEPKGKIKEDAFTNEIDELATNLIDYIGTELPNQGWNRNPRIVNWFRDNEIQPTTQIAQDIYRRALELNQDNKPKSRRYLDN